MSGVRKRIRAEQAAQYIGVSRSTLAKWRMAGKGPPYHRCGPRIVYYFIEEIDAWQAECDRLEGEAARARRMPGGRS
jgi:predicted DNA-binding transcriptional regulator AlpA